MNAKDVRIVELPAMKVASFLGYGEQPEFLAWEKLVSYAAPRGYLEDLNKYRVFGFNNPNPSAGSPNYGYEYWMQVEPETQAKGDVQMKDFEGGLYAVTRCEIRESNYQAITATWKKLVEWVEDSRYRPASHQWLEQHLDTPGDDFNLDLYMPIEV